ncbi:MAG: DUF192 domain-containing protein [bacterium]|nr:DUF192 domain-containing protein [bacterium]
MDSKKLKMAGLLIVVAGLFWGFSFKSTQFHKIKMGNAGLQVEIVNTPSTMARGLMYRKKLPENKGMLFVFDGLDYHSFWMKNTYIPLSIAFITEGKKIVQIEDMAPFDTINFHTSIIPVKYAIEVNQGWFRRHKVKVGDRVKGIR